MKTYCIHTMQHQSTQTVLHRHGPNPTADTCRRKLYGPVTGNLHNSFPDGSKSSCHFYISICDGGIPEACYSQYATITITTHPDPPIINTNSTDKARPKTYCFPTMRTCMMWRAEFDLDKGSADTCPGSTINSSTGLYTYTPQDRYPYQAVFCD